MTLHLCLKLEKVKTPNFAKPKLLFFFQVVTIRTSPIRTNLFDRRHPRHLSERRNFRQLRNRDGGGSGLVQKN
jgi:hypothetical protein